MQYLNVEIRLIISTCSFTQSWICALKLFQNINVLRICWSSIKLRRLSFGEGSHPRKASPRHRCSFPAVALVLMISEDVKANIRRESWISWRIFHFFMRLGEKGGHFHGAGLGKKLSSVTYLIKVQNLIVAGLCMWFTSSPLIISIMKQNKTMIPSSCSEGEGQNNPNLSRQKTMHSVNYLRDSSSRW